MSKRALWLIIVFAVGFAAGVAAMWRVQQRQRPPATSDAQDQAEKLSYLIDDLKTVRSQLELFKVQHEGGYPDGMTSLQWISRLTTKIGYYGPYLSNIPTNPFNGSYHVLIDTDGTIPPGSRRAQGWNACGWHFSAVTGRFSANDSPEHGRL